MINYQTISLAAHDAFMTDLLSLLKKHDVELVAHTGNDPYIKQYKYSLEARFNKQTNPAGEVSRLTSSFYLPKHISSLD